MASWLENFSIRQRIVLMLAGALLPGAVLLGWMLYADVQRARDVANEKVRILATGTAADLQRVLVQTQTALERLASRPLVKALDSQRCDPLVADYLVLSPAALGYAVRDAQGRIICRYEPDSTAPRKLTDASWSQPVAVDDGFDASNLLVDETTGIKFVALSVPIRDDGGAETGLLVIALDVHKLSQLLLTATPKDAVVTVLDRTRTQLLRSANPELIGTRSAGAAGPVWDEREGELTVTGLDGVPRLVAFTTPRGVDWRVTATIPEANVLAEANAVLLRTMAIGLAVSLLALGLAWRLSTAITRPIARLRETAAAIAAGREGVRATVAAPPEIASVAAQFNRVLDARAVSEGRLRGIVESAVDAILTADEHQVIVQANPAAAKMLHCPVDALIGAPLDRFIPDRFRATHGQDVNAFGDGPVTSRRMGLARDVPALRADGSEFPVEASISHMFVAGARFYTVILRDVTKRHEIERALRNSASKLEAALSSMSDAVLITDTEGRFVEFNDAFVSFHRFASKAACKKALSDSPTVLEMFSADGASVPRPQWAAFRALRGEVETGVEYRMRRKDTGEQWIGNFSFAPIRSSEGAIVGAVVTGRDVTATRQVQADLESSHFALQRLIASQDRVQEEERKRIARELHDDLQQTLAAIRMDLRAIGDRYGVGAPEFLALLAGADRLAEQAVVSTRRIVNDLRPPMLEDLGLLPSLELLVAQFSQQTGIDFKIEASDDASGELARTPAIETCLYRIAQEALNNIAKHSEASEACMELLLVRTPEPTMVLRVRDNGRGIDATNRRRPDSFGILGMHERVRAHGGTLSIDSPHGRGTVLEAMVPLAAHAEPTEPDDAPHDAWTPTDLSDARALPRLLSHASHRALQDVIDALAGNVAIVDVHGVIRFVNRAWTEFAERNGNPGAGLIGPGVNYLEVCRRSAESDKGALHIIQGLEDVAKRRRAVFTCEYACHSPNEMRWFQMHATPMASGDFMVAHFLVSRESHPHVVFDAGGVQPAFADAT